MRYQCMCVPVLIFTGGILTDRCGFESRDIFNQATNLQEML